MAGAHNSLLDAAGNVRRATEREDEFSKMDEDIAYFDEDLEQMTMRVNKIRHRMSWSDNPMSRTLHAISNVEGTELRREELHRPVDCLGAPQSIRALRG